jgi:hypothetical protein
VATLRDFAYLYIYYFSTYFDLPDWRSQVASKATAEGILAKPEYDKCKNQQASEAARCVLLDLSRAGRIKLIFVRYDEHRRNVVPQDLRKELSGKAGAKP